MSSWTYVTLAYTVVFGALALYGLFLARRVAQTRQVERSLREALDEASDPIEQDSAVCDAPPAP